jgi:hypothetical protein
MVIRFLVLYFCALCGKFFAFFGGKNNLENPENFNKILAQDK